MPASQRGPTLSEEVDPLTLFLERHRVTALLQVLTTIMQGSILWRRLLGPLYNFLDGLGRMIVH
jgi:hypothetical protein